MRRLRRTPALRRLVAETRLSVDDLVAPLFVREGIGEPAQIASMPGVFQHTVASVVLEAKRLSSLGIPAIVLFGVPEVKDATGSGASDPDGIVQVALRELRAALGDELVLIADLCLDEYTDHGHCGVLRPDGTVDNDATVTLYGDVAVAQARGGGRRRSTERDDGRPGRRRSVAPSTTRASKRRRSWPTRPSPRRPSTGRSVTRST